MTGPKHRPAVASALAFLPEYVIAALAGGQTPDHPGRHFYRHEESQATQAATACFASDCCRFFYRQVGSSCDGRFSETPSTQISTVKDTVILMRSSIGASFRAIGAGCTFRDLSRTIGSCEVIEAPHPPCSFEPPTSFHRTVIERAKCLSEIDFHALFLPSTADLDRPRHG